MSLSAFPFVYLLRFPLQRLPGKTFVDVSGNTLHILVYKYGVSILVKDYILLTILLGNFSFTSYFKDLFIF